MPENLISRRTSLSPTGRRSNDHGLNFPEASRAAYPFDATLFMGSGVWLPCAKSRCPPGPARRTPVPRTADFWINCLLDSLCSCFINISCLLNACAMMLCARPCSFSRAQQCFDGAAFIHRAVALRHLFERQGQIKNFAGVDLPVQHKVNQLGEVLTNWRRTAVKMDMRVEQFFATEFDSVGNADVTNRAARSRAANRLHHGFLSADTFQHGVNADALGQILDAGHPLVTALGHDVSRAKLTGDFLPCRVTAHYNNPLPAHLLRREHSKEADCAITDDDDRLARLDIGGDGGKPASAENIGCCQQARDQVVRRNARRGHERPFLQRHAYHRRLRPQHPLAIHARRLVTGLAMRTGVVGSGKRADDELAWLDRPDRAADLLDDAAVFVTHRRGF